MDPRPDQPKSSSNEDYGDALVLGPEMLRSRSQPAGSEPGAPLPVRERQIPPPRQEDLRPGRVCANECILFDESQQTSWIIYPPRSAYDFVRRPTPETTVVEYHPWSVTAPAVQHPLRADSGCTEHGVECAANVAIRAAIGIGWDPFR